MSLIYLLAALDIINVKRHRISPKKGMSSLVVPDNWVRIECTGYYHEYLEISPIYKNGAQDD